MNSAGVTLLTNAAATGAGQSWPGGRGLFVALATFGGGSVGLEFLGPDGTTWLPCQSVAGAAVTLTAAGSVLFEQPPGLLRASVVTATAVFARADRIPS